MRKRKILATIGLFWSLVFSPIKQGSLGPKSSSFDQQPVHTKRKENHNVDVCEKNSSNSESISSEEEIEALGLDRTEGRLVLGGSNTRLNYPDLMRTIRADREEKLAKPSELPTNIEGKNKVVLIETDLKSQQWINGWINGFISSINRGGQQDKLLIRSILSKLADSDVFDIDSVNKILYGIAEASLSVLSNQKLTRILVELEKPFTRTAFADVPTGS